jgi:hypothetical protein
VHTILTNQHDEFVYWTILDDEHDKKLYSLLCAMPIRRVLRLKCPWTESANFLTGSRKMKKITLEGALFSNLNSQMLPSICNVM